jgi:hypothetical protein
MIADIHKGGGSRSDVKTYAEYMVSRKKDHAEYIEGERVLLVQSENFVSPLVPDSDNVDECLAFSDEIATEFIGWTEEKRNGKPMPTYLFSAGSISFSVEDSKRLTPEKALEIAQRAVADVMPGERPVLYSVHGDTDCLHVHIAAATTGADGKIASKAFDFRAWERSMERLELEYGLERVKQRAAMAKEDPTRSIYFKAKTRAETEIEKRTGKKSPRMIAQDILKVGREQAKTMTNFADYIESRGLEFIPNGKSGRCAGYSVKCHDGIIIKGSGFGKGLSFGGLVKAGVSYDEIRDNAAIESRRARAGGVCENE